MSVDSLVPLLTKRMRWCGDRHDRVKIAAPNMRDECAVISRLCHNFIGDLESFMTSLLIDTFELARFEKQIIPILTLRAITSFETPATFLSKLINDRPRLWVTTVHRPAPKTQSTVQFLHKGRSQLFDARVHVPGDRPKGNRVVVVERVFGSTATCRLASEREAETIPPSEPVEHSLLAISSRHITLVADIMPSKDCWIAVGVWVNELLPIRYALQRPGRMWQAPKQIQVEVCVPDGAGLASGCVECRSSGRSPCRTCDTSGKVDCEKCNGSGIFRPRVTCKKCNGSGNFVGQRGDVIGKCHPCEGNGFFSEKPCRPCSGSGSVSCSRCSGDGTLPCRICDVTGHLRAHFDSRDGTFRGIDRAPEPEEIQLYDWQRRREIPLHRGAHWLLQGVREHTVEEPRLDPQQRARVQDHCHYLSGLHHCLQRSLEAEAIRDTGSVRIEALEPSTQRSHGGVVYETRPKRSTSWGRLGLSPYPKGSSLKFSIRSEGEGDQEFEPKYQNDVKPPHEQHRPFLLGCTGEGTSYRLLICFPAELDVGRMPSDLMIWRDAPRSDKVPQITRLLRWCEQENWDHPILNAVVGANGTSKSMPRIALNGLNPRQAQAVQLGLSQHPLALIKGPPGTGKTTVITEVVKHLVRQGKKVLVCSQTHQAVRNVLERLHEIGGFRMARHVSKEKRNTLSPIEKRYITDVVGDHYFRTVTAKVHSKIQLLSRDIDALAVARRAAQEAKIAADTLAMHRREIAEKKQAAEASLRHHTETVVREYNQRLESALHREREYCYPAHQHLAATQKASALVSIRIVLMGHKIIKIDRRFERKGWTPREVPRAVTRRAKLFDVLVPNWMVGEGTLSRRRSELQKALHEAREVHYQCSTLVTEITHDIERFRMEREHEEILARRDRDTKRDHLEKIHLRQSTQWTEWLGDKEKHLCGIQSRAISHVAHYYELIQAEPDAATWAKLDNDLAAKQQLAEAQREYVTDWSRDMEKDPGAITDMYWDHVQVFFSTCVGAANWRNLNQAGSQPIDLVIVDEAAHATVTETIVPLLYAKRALLIGDEMQLPPASPHNVACRECPRIDIQARRMPTEAGHSIADQVTMADCWLERSFFEWLWRTKPTLPRVELDTQFRMHRLIADFVSSVFYPQGLKTGVTDEDRYIAFGEFGKPVCLVPTSAYKDREEEELKPGYWNDLEAYIVRRILEKAEQELTEPHTFGVVTPYAGQVNLICSRIEEASSWQKVIIRPEDDVGSVDSYQGSERDVIIISFVRSPRDCKKCNGKQGNGSYRCRKCNGRGWTGTGLRFAFDLRRLNVAFSRARKMLILIGDIEKLTSEAYQGVTARTVMERFQRYVSDHGKVLHVWERGHVRN